MDNTVCSHYIVEDLRDELIHKMGLNAHAAWKVGK